jgi:hypothetical protein
MIPNNGHYYTDNLRTKELEIVFRNFETEDHAILVDEYLSMKTPGPLGEKLLRLGEKVPSRWRVGPFRDRDQARRAVIGWIMTTIPPKWELFESAVRAAEASGKTNQVSMRLALAYVGDGASNAVPYVASGLTNGMNQEWSVTLQSLEALGTNVSAALPLLISTNEQKRWNYKHLSIFKNLGPMATDAIPVLENQLQTLVGTAFTTEMAVTLLLIDPTNELAVTFLEKAIQFRTGNVRGDDVINIGHAKSPKNEAIARLAAFQFAHSKNGTSSLVGSLYVLMHHAPEQGMMMVQSRLTGRDWDDLQLIRVLLNHNPNDPVALAYVRDKVSDPEFPNNTLRESWLQLLEDSLPDSQGALDVLTIAERYEDSVIQESVQRTRRHMELNGKLGELRQ